MAAENVIRELLVGLGVKVDPKTKTELRKFNQDVEKVKGQLEDLAGLAVKAGAALVTGLVGVATASGALALHTGEEAENIERQALGLNLLRDEYQELLHVFRAYGADESDMADAFLQINDRASDAVQGGKEAQEQFQRLGISIQELKGLNPAQQFELLADRVSTATDRQKAMAAASSLLGEEMGRKMMPALAKGSAEVRRLRQDAHDLGVVMDDSALATARQVSVQWRTLTSIARGLKNELGVALAPMVLRLATSVERWVRANRELITQRLEWAVRQIERAILAADRAARLVGGWDVVLLNVATGAGMLLLLANLGRVEAVLGALRVGFVALRVAGASAAAALGVPLAPLGLVLLAVLIPLTLLGLAVDDFLTFWRGGQSVLGDTLDLIERWVPGFGALRDLFGALIDLVLQGIDNFGLLATTIAEELKPATEALWMFFEPLVKSMKEAWTYIDKIVSAPLDRLTTLVHGLNLTSAAIGQTVANNAGASVADNVRRTAQASTAAGQSIDNSVRSAVLNATITGPGASDVLGAFESTLRRAGLAVQGGVR